MRRLASLVVLSWLAALPSPAHGQASGEDMTVAILDSGVDGQHPELAGRVERVSFAPLVDLPVDVAAIVSNDPEGQGTAVASLVAGTTLGLAPRAGILDLQVSPSYTGTALDPVAEQAAIDALDFLLRSPGRAQVVVLSFASQGASAAGAATLASQAERLTDKGVLVIVPASPNLSAVHASPAVLTIGAPDCPPSSGRQSGPDQVRKPDLVAPASNLRAAAPGTLANAGPTTTVSGTAFAAAQVAAAAALMLDERQGLPIDALAAILRNSAEDRGDPGPDDCNGFGLLTPGAAVLAAATWVDPLEQYPTKPTPAPAWLGLGGLLAVAVLLRRRA